MNKHVERCPICLGRGIVPAGFYTSTGLTWISDGGYEPCRSCEGKGYVKVEEE